MPDLAATPLTLCGPEAFGRGGVVRQGQPAPADLADAERIPVTEGALDSGGQLIDRLHRLWVARTPYVIELGLDPEQLRDPPISTDPVHTHPPSFQFAADRLSHLIWANTVDHRGEEPRWWHAVKALRACAALSPAQDGDVGDLRLADGTPAWVDGGPRHPIALPDGQALLHRDDTERGVVAPLHATAPSTHDGPAPDRLAHDLAPDQAAAVAAAGNAVRVAAPAGSGKTRVLTARLRELIHHRGYPTDSILALAYNTAAAAELRERVNRGAPGRTDVRQRVNVATVHAHGLAILRRHRGDVQVLDERDVRRILLPLVDPPRRANVDPLQPYIEALERIRTALIAPEVVEDERDDVANLDEVFRAYQDHLRRREAVDFPEMVHGALEVLLTDGAARRAEQARAGAVLVDEFQDLTPAYVLLIRLLAAPQLQVFGVGDDDQVIYGHAGARPDYLLHFDTLFPGAEDHPLTINYRCPAPVVEAASTLLGHNQIRLDKTIKPGPQAATTPIDVHTVPTTQQASRCGEAVDALLADGMGPADIAVLARVRVALLGTQAVLTAKGMPVRSPIGEWLMERTGVSAALAYLRLATDDRMSGDDLASVLHRPLRPIPATIKDHLRGGLLSTGDVEALSGRLDHGGSRRAMRDLARDLDSLRRRARTQPTAEVLRFITDVIGLGDVADGLDHGEHGPANSTPPAGGSHMDDLKALLQVADHAPDPASFEHVLRDVVSQPPPDGDAITLATIHRVKGLEWPAVVLVEAAEGVLPHRLATSSRAVEEERRVFHVAITRAQQRLTVIGPRTGTSRFIPEMQGKPSPVAAPDAPRPTAGTMAARAPRRSARAAGSKKGRPKIRAAEGLQLKAGGGLEGVVEVVTDEGVLVRTARGSLLRLRFGEEVRIDSDLGILSRPA